SAQTGISMIVDPLGRTLASTKLFEQTNITAPLFTTKRIPLLRHIYKYPLVICLTALLLFVAAVITKREK
ncbi:MAG TPA: apolipoprotein N-acyltransferase, partial [Candidatus Cloacimonadota bacterium]|nr:apolipoprotein N-acyltransferase [Candidatus Cloacimonadota bacterium]